MSDSDVFAKLSRILETHSFTTDDNTINKEHTYKLQFHTPDNTPDNKLVEFDLSGANSKKSDITVGPYKINISGDI